MMSQPKFYNLGLIGYPLGHSLSPPIHGAALNALGLEGQYELYPIPPLPEGKEALADLLDQIKAGEIHGLNVTIPHKQNVIPLLDHLTPAAQAIGAVNTIFCNEDQLVGDNTDAPGFWGDLHRLLGDSGQKHSALVLGSGGAARAVVYMLLTQDISVTLSARHEDQEEAHQLSQSLSTDEQKIQVVETGQWSHDIRQHDLIVNCTPVGMHPLVEHSPWPQGTPLPPHAAVYDLVYNPRQTVFTNQAQTAGLPATTGKGMLVEQAALAFERWTGQEAPRDVMHSAVNL